MHAGPAATVPALREQFRAGKTNLLEHFRTARPSITAASRLLKGLTRHVDTTLMDLWRSVGLPADATLIAVGGYGRSELFPYSDVDVLVLLGGKNPLTDPTTQTAVEAFITACWDVGLEIGSSVRTLDECVVEAGRDITVHTAMLESRLICGSRRHYQAFRDATLAALDARAFLRAKTLEMRQRHVKFEDTPYSLEPNCKESPGGLRDLHVLRWVARAAGLGHTWTELAAAGLVTPFEVQQLHRNEGTLELIRARLHLVAGRREDRLLFDLQTAVADSLGYQPTPARRASEALMRRYYWAAKAVVQLNQVLLLNIDERVNGSRDSAVRRIDDAFSERDGLLDLVDDEVYARNPHDILRTFLVYQRTAGINGLSARTQRALYNARNLMDSAFRHDPVNRATFIAVLREPRGQTHVLRLMNQTSVLGRYLWVFRRIVGQMQHDLFHVYTVDQHILMVVRNMRRFFIAEHAHEYPFCSQLASEFDRPEILYIAALFHDVAKGRGGDHSQLGAGEARRFCADHLLADEDTDFIVFLVREHLTMSHLAQKEDLSEPEIVHAFARKVGSVRWLNALYLLTVADIRGTSPKVWNAWKGKLLEDLYRLTLRALGGAQPNLAAEIESRKAEARAQLALAAQLPDTETPLWKTLELSYFARHDAHDLSWHARVLWRHVSSDSAIVRARPSPLGEGLQVLVYGPDRNDLFARICGYFDSAGFNIQDAKIHTTRAGYALDTFQVVYPAVDDAQQGAYRDVVALVENQLTQALAVEGPLPEPRRGRVSRRVRSFPVTPRVSLRPDERKQRWLLSISSSDRSGLLYAIARVLAAHQVNLQLAKIATLGERVEDTFVIDGAQLQHGPSQLRIESELLDALAA